jgi:hypothetical protein
MDRNNAVLVWGFLWMGARTCEHGGVVEKWGGVQSIVIANSVGFLEAWNEFFGGSGG